MHTTGEIITSFINFYSKQTKRKRRPLRSLLLFQNKTKRRREFYERTYHELCQTCCYRSVPFRYDVHVVHSDRVCRPVFRNVGWRLLWIVWDWVDLSLQCKYNNVSPELSIMNWRRGTRPISLDKLSFVLDNPFISCGYFNNVFFTHS